MQIKAKLGWILQSVQFLIETILYQKEGHVVTLKVPYVDVKLFFKMVCTLKKRFVGMVDEFL